jgi:hypothetical protein
VSRLPFERRIAPRSDDRMNSPTSPDRLIVSGYLRGFGAVQASVLNAPLFKERLVGVDVGFEPLQWLQFLVVERLGEPHLCRRCRPWLS